MLGRYKYRNRQYADAIRVFRKVDKESEYYVKSQFFTGISYVQLRKSVPAVESFQRIEKAIDEGAKVEDEARLRDLAATFRWRAPTTRRRSGSIRRRTRRAWTRRS